MITWSGPGARNAMLGETVVGRLSLSARQSKGVIEGAIYLPGVDRAVFYDKSWIAAMRHMEREVAKWLKKSGLPESVERAEGQTT